LRFLKTAEKILFAKFFPVFSLAGKIPDIPGRFFLKKTGSF